MRYIRTKDGRISYLSNKPNEELSDYEIITSKGTITHQENERIEYQEQINSLNNTRKALESQLETSTLTVLEVSSYNEAVKNFKTELKRSQTTIKSL